MKKYVVYGGFVRSKNDYQEHYVSAYKVANLYGVKIMECILIDANTNTKGLKTDGLIRLCPDSDGIYKLPKVH